MVTFFSILVLSCIYLYSSFAVFNEEKHFNVINGTVQDPGDVYFAYYVDNNITRDLPKQNTGYTLDLEKSNCTNGVTITWDDDMWSVTLNYQGYNATDYTRTKCNLYFKFKLSTAVEKITELAATDTINLTTDDYGNIRYIGANPNNYIWFDNDIYQYDTYSLMYAGDYYGAAKNTTLEECQDTITSDELDESAECKKEHSKGDKIFWQIVGVMKDIDDGTGNKEDRVKIIRTDSIGYYSWDTSASSVNNGYGVNEWSQADLMKLLNPGYENESVGGSLYWNNKMGTCYKDENNATRTCDFTSTGINDKLKSLIGDAVWNTGANDGKTYTFSNIITSKSYELERSGNNGKICTSGEYCNDTIERTTIWTGKAGLMYPSDYGYATSGGNTIKRRTCITTVLYNWNDSSVSDCKSNDWLYRKDIQWTLSPIAMYSSSHFIFSLDGDGYIFNNEAFFSDAVYPAMYLLASVKISSGDGSESNPYILTAN